MLSLLRAEALKIGGNRKATWPLIWIYPLGALIVLLIIGAVDVWQESRGVNPVDTAETAESWLETWQGVWMIPAGVRFLMIAFAAVVFGGEYGWNTWKLVAPHRGRVALMLSKHLSAVGWLMAGYLAMAVTWVLGATALAFMLGEPPPSDVPLDALLAGQARGALFTLAVVLVTVAMVSALAVATRSTVAALLIGIALLAAEPFVAPRLAQIHDLLFRAAPGTALGNLQSWIFAGEALTLPTPDGPVADSWVFSLSVLIAWTVGLGGLSVALFRRQDLN